MDWIAGKERVLEYIKKYRYIMLVLLIGIFLISLPETDTSEPKPLSSVEESNAGLQNSLETILSQISGAGKVKVLLTEAVGEQTLYQMDEDISDDNVKQEAVIITNSDREETGLIKQVIPPAYQGAIVVCQGADNANVRLSIVQAVMSVTGLTSDHITVLKMK